MYRAPLIRGFPSLADFIASDVDHSSVIFKRFSRLSARNLLYLQSELAELEAQQNVFDSEDLKASMDEKSTLRDWKTFKARAASGSRRDIERMELARKIQEALKEYKEALAVEATLLSMRQPTKQAHEAFRKYYWNENNGGDVIPTLLGSSEMLYDDRQDLVALCRPPEEDRLSAFFRKYMPLLFLERRSQDSNVHYISARRIGVVVGAINILLAAAFLYGAILNLYYVNSETTRLGLIAGYTTAFALCVALLTNAKRGEIFGACAAYAAVLVVFVSGDLGQSSGQNDVIKMDPLSMSASIVALVQSVAIINKGMRYIASVRKAPAQFLDLQIQLETIQAYLTELQKVLDKLSSKDAPLPPPELSHITVVLKALEKDVAELKSIASDYSAEAANRTDSKGLPRIPKAKWRRDLQLVNSFREKIVQRRTDLVESMRLLQPNQNLAQATLMLDIRDLTKTRFDDLNSLVSQSSQRFESSLSKLTQKLDEGLELLSPTDSDAEVAKAKSNESTFLSCVQDLREIANGLAEHNSRLLRTLEETMQFEGTALSTEDSLSSLELLKHKVDHLMERGRNLIALDNNTQSTNDSATGYGEIINDIRKLIRSLEKAAIDNQRALRRVPISQDFRTICASTVETPWQRAQAILIDGTDHTEPAKETGILRVQATVKPRCNETCKCRCHEVTTVQTPRVFSRALGRLIFSYNSIPVWNSRACNHPKRLKNSLTSVHLNYLFPSWMPRLALAVSASWDSVVGSGASLYLSVPRVVPEYSEIFRAINCNNVSRIQWLFSNRMFLPSDINEDGVCLLTYALYMVKSWPAAKLLLELHPRVSQRDNHGNAPTSIASWKYFVHDHYLPPDINALYRRIMELGDEETNSTVIHDSVIARTSLTVEEAIDLEPQCIDTMDNFGLSPLQWAVLRNNIQGTEVLLSWNPNLELCDYDRRVALHRAAEFGLIECAQMLISKGAYVDASDAWGDTPLHLAISLHSTEMLDLLFCNGAKILRNKYGRTPIHGSTFGSFPHDEVVIEQHIRSLQTAGADINALDYNGMNPLLVAVQQSHVCMFNTLQRHGANLEGKSAHANGRTLFHIAAMLSDSTMVRRLREARFSLIDPDQTDEVGLTAMEMLSRRLTLSAAELSEGQQPASADELSLFQSPINEARERYLVERSPLSQSVSTSDAELISISIQEDPLHSRPRGNQDNSQSNSDTDEFSEAVEY
ncbi:hypothetical protein FLAG1_09514 [Fusarium langsethiae]|uniref:DUF6594 domain-containing protein n=1 Tax=Fusarium langsethiae TaxID=179993 RepID=A0A0N0DC39_FUSLA|nr:hypothetical protein FLAG1_09514 [Fusarium langsethiae]GKU06633.1 unnamed protein product [Fusarium langsethiae]GKU21961.1 unnamed protein product [Fusarium langsethiae]